MFNNLKHLNSKKNKIILGFEKNHKKAYNGLFACVVFISFLQFESEYYTRISDALSIRTNSSFFLVLILFTDEYSTSHKLKIEAALFLFLNLKFK